MRPLEYEAWGAADRAFSASRRASLVGESVGKVFLIGIRTQIGERQHGDCAARFTGGASASPGNLQSRLAQSAEQHFHMRILGEPFRDLFSAFCREIRLERQQFPDCARRLRRMPELCVRNRQQEMGRVRLG